MWVLGIEVVLWKSSQGFAELSLHAYSRVRYSRQLYVST